MASSTGGTPIEGDMQGAMETLFDLGPAFVEKCSPVFRIHLIELIS
jgi:hypothetical protein